MSSTHKDYLGAGYYVTIQHCEHVSGCDRYLGVNYPSDYCDEHQPEGAVIDVCGDNNGATLMEDGTMTHPPHEPHLRWSLFSHPQKRLYCLGYYDQRRQTNSVTVDPVTMQVLSEGGKPWEKGHQ